MVAEGGEEARDDFGREALAVRQGGLVLEDVPADLVDAEFDEGEEGRGGGVCMCGLVFVFGLRSGAVGGGSGFASI